MSSLRVENLIASYGDRKILSGSFFQIESGQTNSIVGRNGCGKSTFLKAVMGMIRGSTENLILNGKSIPREDRFNHFAYLSQQSFLPKNTKVEAIIRTFLSKDLRKPLMEDERISLVLKRKACQLSGGEKRYLEFLLISCLARDVYIFDEPFIGIEPIYIPHVYSRLNKLKEKNKYIILTDHDFHSVQAVSDKIFLSRSGELIPLNEDDIEGELQNKYLPDKKEKRIGGGFQVELCKPEDRACGEMINPESRTDS